jgi:hypothetical protein
VQIREKDIDGAQFIDEARAIIRVSCCSMRQISNPCSQHTLIVQSVSVF